MIIFSLILFVISINLDTFALAFSLHANKIKIPAASSLIIASITSVITVSSLFCGNFIYELAEKNLIVFLGNLLIIITGIYLIIKSSMKKKHKNDMDADIDKSGHIDPLEAFFISISLGMNNAALGIAGGAAGINITISGILTFIFTLLMLIFAAALGKKINNSKLAKISEPLSACILILIGIINIFIKI